MSTIIVVSPVFQEYESNPNGALRYTVSSVHAELLPRIYGKVRNDSSSNKTLIPRLVATQRDAPWWAASLMVALPNGAEVAS